MSLTLMTDYEINMRGSCYLAITNFTPQVLRLSDYASFSINNYVISSNGSFRVGMYKYV